MKVDSSTRNGPRTLQDGLARTQADSTGLSAAGTDTAAASGATGAAQGGANVSLSSLSSTLRSLAASGSADIDTAHVQSIKDAIRNGTLQIDSGKIADGVIQTARDLMKPTSGN
ncbi:flagellar biosynthesis anti-sigma factor FlgM [Paraburkholderia silvatlantica]|uniref:Negative regulator of flagellin synthesis n=1 Tax=Paraburkholderia silvatlantica TaxID=321895 RepID=A0A2U1A0H5_9BURK|nr:flagellar biosynthesis anti-sigma factor FlgM [Paraburkholderia silvatlantica]MBB2931895.1 negative regulator of flagellin synthesis FlgM [Paraburkholderia silvatlantica]PVY24838.1 FlgM family anti-sigma-28 factor [Paraburkholderia silvatlantica]PXW31950.1 FlgM family anti-sigma-28 factor [Paraburkholderia silvatlantica]PYE22801.1 FlgM family anti-sigma-28 factor [Paraburkholderia silvatlantica]TDQ89910.1 FlgM family anti-sigma-28 factor [Paraburkholderia silvatlantica]